MRLYEKRLHKFTYLFCYFAFLFSFFFKSECIAVESIAFLYVHSQIFLLCTWMCFCSSSLNVHIALKSVLLQGLAYISVIFLSEKVALFSMVISKLLLGGWVFKPPKGFSQY